MCVYCICSELYRDVGVAWLAAPVPWARERFRGSAGGAELSGGGASSGAEPSRHRPHPVPADGGQQRGRGAAGAAAVAGGGGGRHGALPAAQAAVLARLPGPRLQPHGVAGAPAVQ